MMENNEEKFEIRDLRQKEQYITDDKFLNGYAKYLEIYAVGVYNSLCRHANKSQKSWPSINFMREELSISRNKIITGIKRLEFWGIIRKQRVGKMANNRYVLHHKKHWKPINLETLKEYSEVHHINFTSLQDKLMKFTTRTYNSKELNNKEIKERDTFKKLKPYYRGMRIVEKSGRKYCIPKDGGQWLEFAGKKEDINWL